jgi:tetratricopeptide (TPR) repeat protein|tara:strand:- start:851 stop:2044 length:1194 start_codon:yes stop_codon:yes gene_type:complete
VSSFAEDVEKFLELAKRKDGSLLEEKKKRREKASLTDKAARETTRKKEEEVKEEEEEDVLLRERGNMHFRRGEYAEAEASYTKSLQGKETAAALSNRAMVRLKLGKAEACAKDCQRSVDLLLEEDEVGEATSKRDGLLVKTWQRKGTAEMEMKMYREAAASFENALRIEPESRTIREQRKAAVKEMEMIEVKDGEVELRARDFLAKRQRVSIEKKKELETPSPAAIVQTKKKEAMAKEEMKTTTMDIEKVRKAISKLDHDEEEIKTGPIFDKQWKLAATSSEKKCKILRAVRAENITKILAERLTGDLLGDIIVAILTHWITEDYANTSSNDDDPVNWLTALTKTNRFSMASMLLSGEAKTNARESWNRCVQRLEKNKNMNSVALDRLEHLRANFRL